MEPGFCNSHDYDLYRDYENLMVQIPKGRITSYGAIARSLGDIKAARAVGLMLSRNDDGERIKCFKVIHSDGRVGKFTHPLGSNEKIRLLREEGIVVKDGNVIDFESKIFDSFKTDSPLKNLSRLQDEMKLKFDEDNFSIKPNLNDEVGAIDVSFYDEIGYGVFVFTNGKRVEIRKFTMKSNFPYIPGYLFFREYPFIRRLLNGFRGILLMDGNGVLHPRGMGLATMTGMLTGLPTIGIAKSVLMGRKKEDKISLNGKTVGKTMWGKYVLNQGYGISLEDSETYLLKRFDGEYPWLLKDAHNTSLEYCRNERGIFNK